MKKALQVTFEMVNGGEQTLDDWMWQQRKGGASFRAIADALTKKVGIPVSHESVRQWLKVG
jgi:transposase